MKNLLWVILIMSAACNGTQNIENEHQHQQVTTVLDAWHEAAAKAEFDNYFQYLADDAIFIGTDATENWNKKDFMAYAKPHFDKGKAWKFKAMERHIFFDPTGKTAWFDELLNTQMKICRGSGVLTKQGNSWKIQHYVLSMTIPNSKSDTVITIKSPVEDLIISQFKHK